MPGPANARPGPPGPGRRLALSWVASSQGRRGKMTICRCCTVQFARGEVRLSRESNLDSGSGRFFHFLCIPGGLHAQDIVQGEPSTDLAIAASMQAARVNPDSHEPAAAERASYDGTEASHLQRGFAFWENWDWHATLRIPHFTLIDVPESLQCAFTKRKSAIITPILALPPDVALIALFRRSEECDV